MKAMSMDKFPSWVLKVFMMSINNKKENDCTKESLSVSPLLATGQYSAGFFKKELLRKITRKRRKRKAAFRKKS